MANNIKELKELLEHHDWYYNYAEKNVHFT